MGNSTSAASLAVEPLTQFFRALGDETRVRIVALLSHGELCVCHVQDALQLTQPNASRQLGILKNAGLVKARKVGSWAYYALAPQLDDRRRRQLRALVGSFAGKTVLRRDIERLLRAKGPISCP